MSPRRNTTAIHYDPAWQDRGLCGVTVERNAPIVLTSDRSKVTCGACMREIIRSLGPLRCAVCGGEGGHDWEVHRANELGY